jgi:hypothetical protein
MLEYAFCGAHSSESPLVLKRLNLLLGLLRPEGESVLKQNLIYSRPLTLFVEPDV